VSEQTRGFVSVLGQHEKWRNSKWGLVAIATIHLSLAIVRISELVLVKRE